MGMAQRTFLATAAFLCLLGAPYVHCQEEPPDQPVETRAETIPELVEQMAQDDYSGMAASRRLAQMREAALPALVAATEHEVARVRYWSIAALSSIGGDRALGAITGRLDDPTPLVRAVAVWHLGRWFNRPEVRHQVVAKLQDGSPLVRGWSLRLIQTKKYADALPAVREVLKAEEPEVRYDALHTLAVLQGVAALETLKEVLGEDPDPLVREGALRCCTVIAPPTHKVAEVFIAALRDKDKGVRETGVQLLRKGFGEYFGFDADGEPLRRDRAMRRWEEWYQANKQKLRWNPKTRRFDIVADTGEAAPEPAGAATEQSGEAGTSGEE